MWSRLIRSSFPPYLFSFLAGVLASVAANLFTGVVMEKSITQPIAMNSSIILFLLASACTAVVAWYLDDMHEQWLREGMPRDDDHVDKIVKRKRVQLIIVSVVTLIAVALGAYQLYLASTLLR